MIKKKISKKKYDFDQLAIKNKNLAKYTFVNPFGMTQIDFNNQQAKIELNKAIIYQELGLDYWEIPNHTLCPIYESRYNYIQWIKDIIQESEFIKGIDIGTGASLIYPLIGVKKFGWKFTATETESKSIENAQTIINKNNLENSIVLIKQINKDQIFSFIQKNDFYNFCMCNPPYYDNLTQKHIQNSVIQENEVCTYGGECYFIKKMFDESILLKKNIQIFTSLVGIKQDFIDLLYFLKSKQNIQIFEGQLKQGKNIRWVIGWKFI